MDGTTTNNNQAADVNAASGQGTGEVSQQQGVQTAEPAANAVQPKEETKDMEQLRAEWEKEKAAAVEEAVQEAAKKAAMKPEEAERYEEQKRRETLEKREKEIQFREMKNDTKDILHEKEIPAAFADFLLGEDMEKTRENITAFKKEFDLAVQEQVEKRLKGTTPKASSGITGTAEGSMAAEIDKFL